MNRRQAKAAALHLAAETLEAQMGIGFDELNDLTSDDRSAIMDHLTVIKSSLFNRAQFLDRNIGFILAGAQKDEHDGR